MPGVEENEVGCSMTGLYSGSGKNVDNGINSGQERKQAEIEYVCVCADEDDLSAAA